MKVKVSRHGNSLGFTIPAPIARQTALEAGQEYELLVEAGGRLSLVPAARRVWTPDLSVADLLAGLPDSDPHGDVPEYLPTGRELDW